MRDQRLEVFRGAVDDLIDSLDAHVRIARWDAKGPKPEPLVAAASKLIDRLGAADRLSAARYQGAAADVAKVDAMRLAMKRLDGAYAAFRRETQLGGESGGALATLESEVGAIAGTSRGWA